MSAASRVGLLIVVTGLRRAWSGFECRQGYESRSLFRYVYTGSEVHLVSYLLGTGLFSGRKAAGARSLPLTSN